MVRNIEKYYDNTEVDIPHKNVKSFIEMKPNIGNAIELGCGAGRDTIYLIKNNWNVLAIDREDVENRIIKKLNSDELKRFRFKGEEFETITLEENNLTVANFSIPFCNKNNFNELWNKIKDSILPNRIFRRKLLWYKR